MLRLGIVAIVLAVAGVAAATTLKTFTQAEIRSKADSILIGRVAKIEYEMVDGRPWTLVSVKTEKTLKGHPAEVLRFRIPGGRQSVDGRTLVTRVDGVPEIRDQERGIFFLESQSPFYRGLLGWEQGFYRLVQKNGADYAVRSDGGETPLKLDEWIKQFQKEMGIQK